MKNEIRLDQHSDYIHFQTNNLNINEKDLLLRMSELKPRLTKFIRNELKYIDKELFEKFKRIDSKLKEFERFFKLRCEGEVDKIFQYKTFISKKDNKKNLKVGSYFGQSKAVSYKNLYLKIISYNSELIELIKKALEYFLVFYNLGQRQSKGFGSFVVEDVDINKFEEILKRKYKFFYKKKGNLKTILDDYQLLKSGINRPYKKSFLWQYFNKKNKTWEKAKIKSDLLRCICNNLKWSIKNPCQGKRVNNALFIRALLGLANFHTYQLVKGNNLNISNNKLNISIKDNNEEIGRFQSPLTFKIFKNTIYVLPNEIIDEIYDREFKFYFKGKLKNDCPSSIIIKTPKKEEFNYEEFLDFALKDNLGYQKVIR